MEYILETNNLTKIYERKEAVKDVNLHIREGEIYGLIGRNGAGKTTIMRIISGLSRPTKTAARNNGTRQGAGAFPTPCSCFWRQLFT